MKTTLEELRKSNAGYAFGKYCITEDDLQKVNDIIDRIEQTRTEHPQVLDCVEYTDDFGQYYSDAIIDGDTYHDGSLALCERGSANVWIDDNGRPRGSISGGAFPRIDRRKLKYIGKREKTFWTFSTLGAGASQGLYFKAEVSCFELNERAEEFKKYTTKDYDFILVRDWGGQRSECGYKFTVEKGLYPLCAFKDSEEAELKDFLALYEAVEEPYWANENGVKKYWILKEKTVYLWNDDEYVKIKADREDRCLFNGSKVPTKFVKEGTTIFKYVLRSDEIRYGN